MPAQITHLNRSDRRQLTGANLTRTNLMAADLTDADLEGVQFEETVMPVAIAVSRWLALVGPDAVRFRRGGDRYWLGGG
nr:pentapeptide repeat-containing protein [Geitlerinema sp. P-1104]